jgi:uncharacterized protein YjiS (DUF1127 family)
MAALVASRPPRWKLAALTWLGIYPSITALLAVTEPVLTGLPLAVRTLGLTAVLAPAMAFVLMPALTKALGSWLRPGRQSGRFGLGIVVRGFARLRRSIEIRQARRTLHGLPDYLLKDIGIRRCEIDSIAETLVDDSDMEPRRPRRTHAY